MRNWKSHLTLAAVLVAVAVLLGGTFAQPIWAQVRAALVRDADNPDLAPFQATISFNLATINDQRLLTTVPAGKRLVIDQVSYYAASVSTDQVIFAALRAEQFGTMKMFYEIHPPHASASSGFVIQDGSQQVKTYFEAGENVWLSVSRSSGGSVNFQTVVTGHYVTP